MDFAIILAVLLVACLTGAVLSARANRRQGRPDPAPVRQDLGRASPGVQSAAYGGAAFGADASGGGDCS